MSALGQKQTFCDAERCPLYPQKRTFTGAVGMSALCQKRTSLLDHLISEEQEGFAYRKTESSGRFEIDGELELIG